ncbi:putative ATP-grasp-modified RiPP [Kitasatospora sp. MAP5-34]|uniref:putative ATP-grasp-modified RiPP n=1 Tax=Kitasatospora sp. MAP5-34 TaxID=3035102 RepID=UPI002476B039|nr:putative ATP-grasp-modified RiPP [Kitasatospora sp. MAP5-34]MDH6579524.1 putative ATP-grasp target RiPP [Kitasatospora sp. MAP5-34]
MSTTTLERPHGGPQVRPFGLTRAVPIVSREEDVIPPLTLCPDRQLSLTEEGTPFIHEPSMTTQSSSPTSYTTTTDHQQWPDADSAPTVDQ